MRADAAVARLGATDPASYLVHDDPTDRADGWLPSAELRDAAAWPIIARDYAADIGSTSVVVGGSCALQGYAGRVAALSVGRWALTGHGLPLGDLDTRVRLRSGRTIGLWVPEFDEERAPRSPEALADQLVAHLTAMVDASRAVSRLRPKVAWGNVAAAVAGAWRRVHDSVDPGEQGRVRYAAAECLAAASWPWATAPITWEVRPAPWGESLTYRRHTCCLIRLAPEKRHCGSCGDLTEAEVRQRWDETLVTFTPIRLEVGVGVGQ